MNVFPYLCLGGVEVANGNRMTEYIRQGHLGPYFQASCDPCLAIDGGDFLSPSHDDAPWYDSNVWSSGEFMGLLPTRMEVLPNFSRTVTNRASGGGNIGKVRLRPRVLSFTGLLMASTVPGMAYGESWLREVLAGNRCASCGGDEAIYLPACPDEGYEDTRNAFRRLISVGVTDGPAFAPLGNFPEGKVQQVTFQLVSSSGYIYQLSERCLDTQLVSTGVSCSMTTLEWGEGGSFRIEISNAGSTTATDITITGQISLDGSCPVTNESSSVPPSWTYTIPSLEPEAAVVIDGPGKQVLYYDPSDKFYSAGMAYLDLPPGRIRWPDVGPCTTMCVTITRGTGDVAATVDTSLREV